MVISTHLPPPVMIDSAAVLDAVTHILCCSWAMCFSAAPSSEKFHGSMNLASNTAPVAGAFIDENGGGPEIILPNPGKEASPKKPELAESHGEKSTTSRKCHADALP